MLATKFANGFSCVVGDDSLLIKLLEDWAPHKVGWTEFENGFLIVFTDDSAAVIWLGEDPFISAFDSPEHFMKHIGETFKRCPGLEPALNALLLKAVNYGL